MSMPQHSEIEWRFITHVFYTLKKMRMGWNSQAEQCWEAHRRDRIWTQMSCRKSTQPKCLTNPSRWNYTTHVKICVALFVRHVNSPPIGPFVLLFLVILTLGVNMSWGFWFLIGSYGFICGIWMNLLGICWESCVCGSIMCGRVMSEDVVVCLKMGYSKIGCRLVNGLT